VPDADHQTVPTIYDDGTFTEDIQTLPFLLLDILPGIPTR
jgi:hypothetical protein